MLDLESSAYRHGTTDTDNLIHIFFDIMHTYVINTTYTAWNETPRSRHQVANELKNYGKVYFITKSEIGLPGHKVKEHDGIYYVIPSWPVDYRIRYRVPVFNETYQYYLHNLITKLGLEDGILVNFDHTAYILTGKFEQSVYYCSDHHIGNDDLNISLINRYQSFTERKVSERSTFCIGTSDFLFSKLKKYNPDSYLILLGAPNIQKKNAKYANKSSKENIKVCYVGAIQDRRIDENILKSLIGTKNIELYIIGSIDEKFQKLLKNEARLLGIKKFEELYICLKEMHVGIMPYRLRGINKGGTPNKYWLYTACGLPSVSTPLPNILNWPQNDGLLYLSSPADFVDKIREAFNQDSKDKYLNRIKYAQENTWEKRIEEFMKILNNEMQD